MQDRTASPTSLHLMRPAEPSPETGDFTGFLSAADARHPADVLIGIGRELLFVTASFTSR